MAKIPENKCSDIVSDCGMALPRRTLMKLAGAGLGGVILSVGNVALAAQVGGDSTKEETSDTPREGLFMLELAKQRRSIRRYTDEPLDRATLDNILKTALFAPASHGRKNVEFVVVQDKATLDALARCKRIGAPSVRAASATVVVIVDRNSELWIEDASVASTFLLLAAEAHGIGACWNHVRGRQGQRGSSEEEIRQLLGIPNRYAVLNIVAMGHKGERKPGYSEADVSPEMIHYGKFTA